MKGPFSKFIKLLKTNPGEIMAQRKPYFKGSKEFYRTYTKLNERNRNFKIIGPIFDEGVDYYIVITYNSGLFGKLKKSISKINAYTRGLESVTDPIKLRRILDTNILPSIVIFSKFKHWDKLLGNLEIININLRRMRVSRDTEDMRKLAEMVEDHREHTMEISNLQETFSLNKTLDSETLNKWRKTLTENYKFYEREVGLFKKIWKPAKDKKIEDERFAPSKYYHQVAINFNGLKFQLDEIEKKIKKSDKYVATYLEFILKSQ